MNKRKISTKSSVQMLPHPKQMKLTDSCAELLDGIDFVDFDDEFTSSEGTSDEQPITETTANKQHFVDNLLHGIDFGSFDESDSNQLLDLSTWKRCIVDNCQRNSNNCDLILTGHEDTGKCDEQKTNSGTKMMCRLQHFWSQCRIEVGDIISIIAIWNVKLHSYCVTNTDGFVVVRPDFLISGTTVVSGLFCMRKAILQDRFKGIEAGVKIVSHILILIELLTDEIHSAFLFR